MITVTVLISALLAQVAATEAPPKFAEATSKWAVDYGEKRCAAFQAFKTGYGDTVFQARPGILSDQMEIILTFFAPEGDKGDWGMMTMSWNGKPILRPSDGEPAAKSYEIYVMPKNRWMVVIPLKLGEDVPVTSTAKFAVNFANAETLAFKVENWSAVLKALDTCNKDLLVDLGINPQSLALIDQPAEGSVGKAFSVYDYPTYSLSRGDQGTVEVLYWVDEDGRTRDCQILISSGSKVLDDRTCEVINKRGKLRPARDHEGNSVRAPKTDRIRWQLP